MITRAFLSRHDYDALSFSDMMRFFPKLTALQCRFTVSLAASLVVLCIYLFVWNPRFAYAAEMESAPPMTLDELHVDTYSIQDMIQGDEHDTTAYSIHDHDHEQDTNTHHVHDSKRAVGDTVTLAGNNIPGLLNMPRSGDRLLSRRLDCPASSSTVILATRAPSSSDRPRR
jgi:hypothetical protein